MLCTEMAVVEATTETTSSIPHSDSDGDGREAKPQIDCKAMDISGLGSAQTPGQLFTISHASDQWKPKPMESYLRTATVNVQTFGKKEPFVCSLLKELNIGVCVLTECYFPAQARTRYDKIWADKNYSAVYSPAIANQKLNYPFNHVMMLLNCDTVHYEDVHFPVDHPTRCRAVCAKVHREGSQPVIIVGTYLQAGDDDYVAYQMLELIKYLDTLGMDYIVIGDQNVPIEHTKLAAAHARDLFRTADENFYQANIPPTCKRRIDYVVLKGITTKSRAQIHKPIADHDLVAYDFDWAPPHEWQARPTKKKLQIDDIQWEKAWQTRENIFLTRLKEGDTDAAWDILSRAAEDALQQEGASGAARTCDPTPVITPKTSKHSNVKLPFKLRRAQRLRRRVIVFQAGNRDPALIFKIATDTIWLGGLD